MFGRLGRRRDMEDFNEDLPSKVSLGIATSFSKLDVALIATD